MTPVSPQRHIRTLSLFERESLNTVCPTSIIHAIWSVCIIRDGKQLLSQKQIVGLERTEGIWSDNVRTGTGLDGVCVYSGMDAM